MNKIKILFVVFGIILMVSSAGCIENLVKKPEVSASGFKYDSIDNEGNIVFKIKVNVSNENPIGVKLKSLDLKIYCIKSDGSLVEVGKAYKEDVKIDSGSNIIEIPVVLSKDKLIDLAMESSDGKLNLLIKGTANIDAIITTISVPIEFKRTVDVGALVGIKNVMDTVSNGTEGVINGTASSLTEVMNKMGFEKPKVSIVKTEYAGKDNDGNPIVNVYLDIQNPNSVKFTIKSIQYDIISKSGAYLGHGEISNIEVLENSTKEVKVPTKMDEQSLKSVIMAEKSFTIPVVIDGSVVVKGLMGMPDKTIIFKKEKDLTIPESVIQ